MNIVLHVSKFDSTKSGFQLYQEMLDQYPENSFVISLSEHQVKGEVDLNKARLVKDNIFIKSDSIETVLSLLENEGYKQLLEESVSIYSIGVFKSPVQGKFESLGVILLNREGIQEFVDYKKNKYYQELKEVESTRQES